MFVSGEGYVFGLLCGVFDGCDVLFFCFVVVYVFCVFYCIVGSVCVDWIVIFFVIMVVVFSVVVVVFWVGDCIFCFDYGDVVFVEVIEYFVYLV